MPAIRFSARTGQAVHPGDISPVQVRDTKAATAPPAAIFGRRQAPAKRGERHMHKYIIERDIPQVGTFERDQLREAAKTSNSALAKLGVDIQWVESFVAADKTFCVYLAKDEALIRRHAELSGFPATRITMIGKMIDPTTASA